MKFCSQCGARMHFGIPVGDDRQRYLCPECEHVSYQNPHNVVGCVVEHEGKILLCKRAIGPRKNFWTLPAGFMELGETMAEGAARETREEACAQAHIDGLFTLLNIPDIGQVHLFYRAHLPTPAYAPGPESLAVALVDEADVPWRQLAFPSIHRTLELYFTDRSTGHFAMREETIHKGAWQRMDLDKTPDDNLRLG